MLFTRRILLLIVILILSSAELSYDYPVDGYKESGIRRVERLRIRIADSLRGFVPVDGGRKSIADIQLNFLDHAAPFRNDRYDPLAFLSTLNEPFQGNAADQPVPFLTLNSITDSLHSTLAIFPKMDSALEQRLKQLFANRDRHYSLALMEITPGRKIRYAGIQPHWQYAPGSVGKIAIAVGLFNELFKIYPGSLEKRQQILRETTIIADDWIHTDSHGVPLFDMSDSSAAFRPIKEGDAFSLFEWVDHMISPSSNAAASTVWREAMLLRHFGRNYPPSAEAAAAFLKDTPRMELAAIALDIVNKPLREIGIAEQDWRLGSFFTRAGKDRIPATGGSFASPQGLLLFLLRMEQGRVVDEWSSLEIKRLMYMTEKRIRYASAPRLEESAVYFKSGSLYRCQEEAGFTCGKYKGNLDNFMNSVAIVERPDGVVYLVALMSNVLKINSAVEHQSLATFIDRML